jgi:Anti-sigma factor NepR
VPDKSSGRPGKRAKKAASRSASPLPPEDAKADQYIAEQLKAMYDAVVVEPIPDRLLQLLDRLDDQPEQRASRARAAR